MERTPNCGTAASLVALVILALLPVRSWCEEEAYISQPGARPECRVTEDAKLKRFDDGIDYDSFVSLMGRRRSAAQPNGHMDHILAGLLGRRTRMACPLAKEYLPTRRGPYIKQWRQRFQRFL